jgi:multicomponent K+:H+ antiporter subunit G
MMPLWLDIIVAILIVLGATFALIGSYGLVKLSDFLKRLHGPTKASTLGVGCVLIASILYFTFMQRSASVHELLITIFIFLTAPVSAHLLIKAAMKRHQELQPPPLPPPLPLKKPD